MWPFLLPKMLFATKIKNIFKKNDRSFDPIEDSYDHENFLTGQMIRLIGHPRV